MIAKLMKLGLTGASILVMVSAPALASTHETTETALGFTDPIRLGNPATDPDKHVLVTAAVPAYTRIVDPADSSAFIYTVSADPDADAAASVPLFTNEGTAAAPDFQAAVGTPWEDEYRTKTLTETVDEGTAASATNAQGVADNAKEIIDANDAQDAARDTARTQEIDTANTAQDGVRDTARDTAIGDANDAQDGVRDVSRDTAIGDANTVQNVTRDASRTTEIGDANAAQDVVRDASRTTEIGDANAAQDVVRDAARTVEIGDANAAQDVVRDAARTVEIDDANIAQDVVRDASRKAANDAQDIIINDNADGVADNKTAIGDWNTTVRTKTMTQTIDENVIDIRVNRADIDTNTKGVATNRRDIGVNRAAIAENAGNITDIEGGVAMAIALDGVDFVGAENFGIALNWGNFKDSNALALSAAGVVGRGIFGEGDRLTVSGGAAFLVGGDGREEFAGRVGMQLTW